MAKPAMCPQCNHEAEADVVENDLAHDESHWVCQNCGHHFDDYVVLARALLVARAHDCADNRLSCGCCQECLEAEQRLTASDSLAERLRSRLPHLFVDLAVRDQLRDECIAWLKDLQIETEHSPSQHVH